MNGFPRIVVAGTHSGVGKTTITLGMMAAFVKRGLVVQGFKVGPDYIDPAYHTEVTERPSRNLDTWMLDKDWVLETFHRGSLTADIAVIEGVMGLFDGKDSLSNVGTTAEVSELLNAPILLVIDAAGMARSAAAVVKGYQTFHPTLTIAGVIVNRVGGEGHYRLVKSAIESACLVPVVGYLPGNAQFRIPERHLGLLPAIERGELKTLFDHLAETISATVELDRVYKLACEAPPLPSENSVVVRDKSTDGPVVIAVARDAAFNFYYPENLELLEHCAAKLVFFSPLAGDKIPDEANGLYIGGGFPEEFAARLSGHTDVLDEIRYRIELGLPTYAECGGMMFLAEELVDGQGQSHPMVGIIPARVAMQERIAGFGYREVTSPADNWLLCGNAVARGHEFHYSTIEFRAPYQPAYHVLGPDLAKRLNPATTEGYLKANVVAGYTHLHFASNPTIARNFVLACRTYQDKRATLA